MRKLLQVSLVALGVLLAVAAWLRLAGEGEFVMVVATETHSEAVAALGPETLTAVDLDVERRHLAAGDVRGRWLSRRGGVVLSRVEWFDQLLEETLVGLGPRPLELVCGGADWVISALPGPLTLALSDGSTVKGWLAEHTFSLAPGQWWSSAWALTPGGVQMTGVTPEAADQVGQWRDAGYPVSVIRVMNLGLWPRSNLAVSPAVAAC